MRRWLCLMMIGWCGISASAQNIFSEEAFIAVVKTYHPLAKRAGLVTQAADAMLTSSRGKFDPVFDFDRNRKDLQGVTYYDQQQLQLKIPTWYGIDLYAGTEQVNGQYNNPELTPGTLSYVGVSVPVLRNLLMDKRRAALQQARIYQQQSRAEQRAMINDLLREALQAYWNWWAASQDYELVKAALRNASVRFSMVKTAWRLGDRPAIDTLEALTQVQQFQVAQSASFADLQKARWELSAYCFRNGEENYILPDGVQPEPWSATPAVTMDSLLTRGNTHPELLQYQFKLQSLEVEKRLKFQSLLPEFNLKYQQIGKGNDFGKTINQPWFNNNYRFGVGVSVPLRFSEGRGDYRLARIKLEQTRLEQINKAIQVQNKIRQYFTEWEQLQQQIQLQTGNTLNYAGLQRGEETRFTNGESSLFLVNARELKTLEANQKLIDLQAKSRKAWITMQWASGTMPY